jgi:hypothetical protein
VHVERILVSVSVSDYLRKHETAALKEAEADEDKDLPMVHFDRMLIVIADKRRLV